MTRTWQERCEDFDDSHITTHQDVKNMMMEEIEELREALTRAQVSTDADRFAKKLREVVNFAHDGVPESEGDSEFMKGFHYAKELLRRMLK